MQSTTDLINCLKCKKQLPKDAFGKHKIDKQHRNGVQAYCKECSRSYNRNKYHSDTKTRETIRNHAHTEWIKTKTDPIAREHKKEIDNKASRRYRETHLVKKRAQRRAVYVLDKSGLKPIIWERAKGKCESCNTLLDKKRHFAFHHLNKNPSDNRLDNIVLVCTFCHLHKYHKGEQNKS